MSTTSTDTNNYYAGLDAYQILGVPRNADAKVIKSAYRKLVAQWHPDKFPDDQTKKAEGGMRMEKINRAYYILSDDDRRRRYDQFGEQGVGSSAASEEQIRAAGGPGMGGFGDMGGSVDVQDISDIFEQFFGGGGMRGGRGQQRTRNANAPVAGTLVNCNCSYDFV
jgi:molecular chaperone DnaJ